MRKWNFLFETFGSQKLILFAMTSFFTLQLNAISPDVIYGEDNRKDLFEVMDSKQLDLADSTVAMINNFNLVFEEGIDSVRILTTSYSANYNLCPTEKFFDQRTAASCSGFLVSEDTVVTAGHCVSSQNACEGISFIFGFGIKALGTFPSEAPLTEVYRCKTLVKSEALAQGRDFAIVKLDRSVPNHRPLQLRKTGAAAVGDSLAVIGHPAGLPTKISDGASVRSLKTGFFVANLDTYGGNSGSAVFSASTGEVEGILVRGETDFSWKNSCRVSNVCTDDACRGEDVTLISEVIPYLK